LPTGFAGTATIEVFPWIGVAATLAIANGEGVLTAPLAEQPLNTTQTSARAQNTFRGRRIRSRRRKPMLPSYMVFASALVDMDPLSYNTTLDYNLRAAQRVPLIRELLISLTALDSISVTTLLKFEL
jgi:hypothetical protein